MRAISRPIVAALAAMLLTAGAADRIEAGVCGEGVAVDADDADCLEASKETTVNKPIITEYTVKNACSHLGKVVAIIDREKRADKTIELTDNQAVSDTVSGYLYIKCCDAEGTLCNSSKVITTDKCVDAWNTSPAVTSPRGSVPRRCHTDDSDTYVKMTDSLECEVCARCPFYETWNAHHDPHVRSCKTLSIFDVSKLRSCFGKLKTTCL